MKEKKVFIPNNIGAVILLLAVVSLIGVQIYKRKFDIFEYIPNLVTETIGIVFTVYLIGRIIEYKKKKDDRKVFNTVCKNEYDNLLRTLDTTLISFIVHDTVHLDENETKTFRINLSKYIDNLDEYIKDDFIKNQFPIINGFDFNTFTPKTVYCDYFTYQKEYFKDPMKNKINDFLLKYSEITPSEIRNRLINILDELNNVIFDNVLDYGLPTDNVKMDINYLRDTIKKIIIILQELDSDQ